MQCGVGMRSVEAAGGRGGGGVGLTEAGAGRAIYVYDAVDTSAEEALDPRPHGVPASTGAGGRDIALINRVAGVAEP